MVNTGSKLFIDVLTGSNTSATEFSHDSVSTLPCVPEGFFPVVCGKN